MCFSPQKAKNFSVRQTNKNSELRRLMKQKMAKLMLSIQTNKETEKSMRLRHKINSPPERSMLAQNLNKIVNYPTVRFIICLLKNAQTLKMKQHGLALAVRSCFTTQV